MFIETIKTPGLAHLSYILGSAGEAVVIDPRRDIDIYVDVADQNECRITHIFETHRNEDLISGAPILSRLTGAEVLHGPNADGDVQYAKTVTQGHQVKVGSLTLEVLETPGHTKDSICILIFDQDYCEGPVGILTGDTLFVGDVGRTDFYPQEREHVAGLLYDSLQKIKHRAPEAIIYPAHGAGSVCGDGMADREFSTVQHEIKNNPMLKISDRTEFIDKKVAEHHYIPPYFSEMERLNLKGASAYSTPQVISPIPADQLIELQQQGYKVIDVRSIESYLGAHLPGSYSLPVSMITSFAGWMFDNDARFILIADEQKMASCAALHLARIGYANCHYYFSDSLAAVATGGMQFESLDVVDAEHVKSLIEQKWNLLDVRKVTEYEQGHIAGSEHVFLGHLDKQICHLAKDKSYITMCASGMRATIAGAFLQANGFNNVKVFMGSMGAWKAKDYPVE
ncbi:MBL fold metallo-hydrolase [Aliiglaciecola sp. LCG003]|uniref:MBL fold metallo-hydrolase n=1 Tax=Aliiglaciecola sp. LCG003 TaxID=3053655 RepID=UPI0025730559|nr:MBL fold metallo-hydrolase [Aliiglaciecola sp. LCG003]WJG10655.1 MBL fold metallo-hydrolase [Aliiglaciecola sp. LCG003]